MSMGDHWRSIADELSSTTFKLRRAAKHAEDAGEITGSNVLYLQASEVWRYALWAEEQAQKIK